MIPATTQADKQRFTAIGAHIPNTTASILDVGCVRHSRAQRAYGNLHAYLYEIAPEATIIGVDRPGEETEQMQSLGYDIRAQDAQQLDLEREFEVIVAGELIEHLENPGLFLESATNHLTNGGKLILTTPNPEFYRYSLKILTDSWTSDAHTCWIDPNQVKTLTARATNRTVQTIEYLAPTTRKSRAMYRFSKRFGSPTYLAVIA